MNFNNFSELREFIRRYNSTSILEVGTKKCWQIWEIKYSDPLDWTKANTERNYAIRLMLLASAGNPYRSRNITVEEFDHLINVYHSWNKHTISDKHFFDEEAKALLSNIKEWEDNKEKTVRTWSVKLSKFLELEKIRTYGADLFLQRMIAFQNSGFGYPISRIDRTIKFIELLNKQNENFSDIFLEETKLSTTNYFRQFLACLGMFCKSSKKGFCNLSQNIINDELQELGILPQNLEMFFKQNSQVFTEQSDISFRGKVNQMLLSICDFYQPFFYNHFLENPLVELNNKKFCLPDPFSFTESCWNQIKNLVFKEKNKKRLEHLLSRAFEDYLENVLFPCLDISFKPIPKSQDKRADFLIETPSSYIVVECKNSLMSADTSAYFQPDQLADLWNRIHSASEQISSTVKAFNLNNKPVIPLIITFYDSIGASSMFETIIKQTNYCVLMKLDMSPIVYSLHEFEHLIYNRSIENWAELILSKQNGNSPIELLKPDNKGHNYKHLKDISIL